MLVRPINRPVMDLFLNSRKTILGAGRAGRPQSAGRQPRARHAVAFTDVPPVAAKMAPR
jgi:hypothetical protein